MDELLKQCAEKSGWQKRDRQWIKPQTTAGSKPSIKTGFGIALGMKNIGFSFGYPEESTATIILRGNVEIESVDLLFAGAECGQGVQTVIQQMAAEALNVPIEIIHLVGTDTARSPESGSASASRLTLMGGNAVIGAAKAALQAWKNEERPATGTYTYRAPATSNYDPQTGYAKPHVVFSPIAQAVEITVDTETGEVKVPRVVSVVDSGQAINPNLLSGQIDGAVVQGLGYAVTEHFITQEGMIKTPDLTTYLIPTVLDIPELNEAYLCEHQEAIGPWGARGIGETPIIAIAPAITAGVHDAIGIWLDQLPLTPQVIFSRLHEKSFK